MIAVDGTTLNKASNTRGWSESAWNGAGSGGSSWVGKPSWQDDPNCPGRMTADVAADADPETGPAIYDTDSQESWMARRRRNQRLVPFIAGVIALAGNPQAFGNACYLYSHVKALHDITTGSNAGNSNSITAFDCGGDYQCNALPAPTDQLATEPRTASQPSNFK